MSADLKRACDWANKFLTPIFSGLGFACALAWQFELPSWLLDSYPNRTGLYEIIIYLIPRLGVGFYFLSSICSFMGIFTKKTVGRLEKEVAEKQDKLDILAQNIQSLLTGTLVLLSQKIEFEKGEKSRLTIYIHNGSNGFTCFARFSYNPEFQKKRRSTLPDNQGCISNAWRYDWCYEGNLDGSRAKKCYNISKKEYSSMRMKSVFYAVKKISTQDNKKTPLAVIVFESETRNRLSEESIKSIMGTQEPYFADIISSLKDYIPHSSDLRKEGL